MQDQDALAEGVRTERRGDRTATRMRISNLRNTMASDAGTSDAACVFPLRRTSAIFRIVTRSTPCCWIGRIQSSGLDRLGGNPFVTGRRQNDHGRAVFSRASPQLMEQVDAGTIGQTVIQQNAIEAGEIPTSHSADNW